MSRFDSFLKNNISLFLKNSLFFPQREKEKLLSLPRSFWQKQIGRGRVIYQGKRLKSGTKINFQDISKISIDWKKIKRDFYFTKNLNKVSYPASLHILKNEKDFLVINKPAGLSVHQSEKINLAKEKSVTLVEIINSKGLLDKNFDDPRAGIVHRLDKRTSGLLIIAKNSTFQKEIKKKFKSREVKKKYLALVRGNFPYKNFYIHGLIGKKQSNPKIQGMENLVLKEGSLGNISSFWKNYCLDAKNISQPNKSGIINPKTSLGLGMVVFSGKINEIESYLRENNKSFSGIFGGWKDILENSKNSAGKLNEQYSLLKMFPLSGRTHQIRVHLSKAGFSIVGDDTYGGFLGNDLPCHFLHAFNLHWEDNKNRAIELIANKVFLF